MISLKNVKKSYKGTIVIDNISLKIKKGEIVVLIGPSGCGKTTTLKMINGLEKLTDGEIMLDGKSIKDVDLIKLRRNMGYVIQQTGLFPHMTVQENIEIIPKLSKMDKSKVSKKTIELMNLIGLEPEMYLWRYPTQLSGGQMQRIGVARAFAMDPEIILMDEPFSALDPVSREQLQDELLRLQDQLHKTIVFVTHDMNEAIKLADRICIMNKGEVVQFDTPEQILKNPTNKFVEEFVGANRIWSNPDLIKAKDIMITTPVTIAPNAPLVKAIELMRMKRVDSLLVVDSTLHLLGRIRPRHIRIADDLSALVGDVMVEVEHIASPDDTLVHLLELFKISGKTVIPVADENNKLKGLITKSSLVTTLSSQFIELDRLEDK